MPQHLGSESVVTEEDVADTGYQNSRGNEALGYIRRILR
jgi:hypothetical protein